METSAEAVTTENTQSSDRLAAMCTHLSIFFGSLIVPLVIWLIYSNKNKFVVFHSAQSLVFHLIYTAGIFFIGIVLAVIYYTTGIFDKNPPPAPGIFTLLVILAISLLSLVFIFGSMGYAIYLAISAYGGSTKKYPLIGSMIYKKIYRAV